MALEHIEKIKCKDCSCEFDITVYESVNGAFDDEAQKKLLTGELFTHLPRMRLRCVAFISDAVSRYG